MILYPQLRRGAIVGRSGLTRTALVRPGEQVRRRACGRQHTPSTALTGRSIFTISRRKRRALSELQAQLRAWRRDHALRFHTRAIIVVERLAKRPSDRQGAAASRSAAGQRVSAQAMSTAFSSTPARELTDASSTWLEPAPATR